MRHPREGRHGPHDGNSESRSPIRLAIGILLIAVHDRPQAEGFTDEIAQRVAAIPEKAAGRIERL